MSREKSLDKIVKNVIICIDCIIRLMIYKKMVLNPFHTTNRFN